MFKTLSILKKSFVGLEYRLFEAVELGHINKVKSLIDQGADLESRDLAKNTPLHIACMVGDLEIAKLLIEKGADVNAINDNGFTPLSVTNAQHQNVISYLENIGGLI